MRILGQRPSRGDYLQRVVFRSAREFVAPLGADEIRQFLELDSGHRSIYTDR